MAGKFPITGGLNGRFSIAKFDYRMVCFFSTIIIWNDDPHCPVTWLGAVETSDILTVCCGSVGGLHKYPLHFSNLKSNEQIEIDRSCLMVHRYYNLPNRLPKILKPKVCLFRFPLVFEYMDMDPPNRSVSSTCWPELEFPQFHSRIDLWPFKSDYDSYNIAILDFAVPDFEIL